jgi:hypothetical protein
VTSRNTPVRKILWGVLPGPYNPRDAHRYARACLIPTELLQRSGLAVDRVACALEIPACELLAAHAEHAEHAARIADRFGACPRAATE